MSVVDNLNEIKACKQDIKQAIVDKGVDMTNVPLSGYAGKIGEIQTGGQTEELTVTANGTYTPAEGVDGYSKVTVDVPQEVEGYTVDDIATGNISGNITGSASVIETGIFAYWSNLTGADFPNATIIRGSAFIYCSNLTSVNFPNVTNVSSSAFAYCSNLTSVNFPNVTNVSAYAFQNCYSLQSVNMPNVIYISSYTFRYCSNLTSVNFPNVTIISNYAFAYCVSLASLTVGTDLYYVPTLGTNAFSNTPMVNSTYLGQFGSIYVPISLVDSYKAATNWVNVKDRIVGIGDPDDIVLSFANNSLYGRYRGELSSADNTRLGINSASALYHIDLPNVNSVSYYTFTNYRQLQTVNMPNVEYIGDAAFQSCHSLQTVNMPNVTTIGSNAFIFCSSLQTVNMPNVSYIGSSALIYCISLQSVNMPNVEYIGDAAFQSCHSLQSIDLPNVEYIGAYAFQSCHSLQTVNMPNVTGIYRGAFQGCSSLEKVYVGMNVSKVVSLSAGAFTSTPMATSTLTGNWGSIYVPASLVDAYKSATYWSDYKFRITAIPE